MTELHGWVHFYVGLSLIECKKKVKFTPEQAVKSQRVSIAIALHFL